MAVGGPRLRQLPRLGAERLRIETENRCRDFVEGAVRLGRSGEDCLLLAGEQPWEVVERDKCADLGKAPALPVRELVDGRTFGQTCEPRPDVGVVMVEEPRKLSHLQFAFAAPRLQERGVPCLSQDRL